MAMDATVTISGPALDVQHAVTLVEGEPMGGPIQGAPGVWQWKSEREDIVDRAISHSREFPDLHWDVEGVTVDGFSREEVTATISDGSGSYVRTDFGRPNRRIPGEIVYDALIYDYRLRGGRAQLVQVLAKVTADGEFMQDVTRFFSGL